MLNTRVVLARRPDAVVTEDCFRIERVEVGGVPPGCVLVRSQFLSCDPYLRLEMNARFDLDAPIRARATGHIASSADPYWPVGAAVWGFLDWAEYTIVETAGLHRIDPLDGALRQPLGARGMNGLTAWAGMMELGRPTPGDTIVVSAGAGSVGSIAGQLARLAGARTVAVVGGERKVRHAIERLGYHVAVDHMGHEPLEVALGRACPDGVDIYFDNVGGAVLDAVLPLLNRGARLAMCGVISKYDGQPAPQPDLTRLMGSGVTATWFSVHDYMPMLPTVSARIGQLLDRNDLVYVEDIVDGVENAPAAFLRLFTGETLGKVLVRVH